MSPASAFPRFVPPPVPPLVLRHREPAAPVAVEATAEPLEPVRAAEAPPRATSPTADVVRPAFPRPRVGLRTLGAA